MEFGFTILFCSSFRNYNSFSIGLSYNTKENLREDIKLVYGAELLDLLS
jgi:hypothetical protein